MAYTYTALECALAANNEKPMCRAISRSVANNGFAILDQVLFAGTHFLLNVALARWLPPVEYGSFALAYSIFLLAAALHNAVLTEPMLVFGPAKHEQSFNHYLGALIRGHFLFAIPCSVALVVTGLLLGHGHGWTATQPFVTLAAASPFLLLMWLLRRACYVYTQPRWAAAAGLLYFALVATAMGWFRLHDQINWVVLLASLGLSGVMCRIIFVHVKRLWLTISSLCGGVLLSAVFYALANCSRSASAIGFLSMGLAALLVSGLLLVQLDPALHRDQSAPRQSVMHDHWRYGKWSLATALTLWIPTNSYYVLLLPWMHLNGIASLRAIMNLAMPFLQIFMALQGLLIPRLVRERRLGPAAIKKTLRSYVYLFFLGSALYSLLLWLFRSRVLELLYAGKYAMVGSTVILLIGLYGLAAAISTVFGSALLACERPDLLFWCYAASSVVAGAVGIPLGARLGVTGAFTGLLLSSCTAGLVMYVLVLRCLRREAIPALSLGLGSQISVDSVGA
jgi:O-antigen/teichoic acid export membrane protein